MTRLEKRIAFDMGLFFVTLITFWTQYQEEYNIMDKVWSVIVGSYLISSAASIYAVIVTNKYLKDFCILISFIRFGSMLYFLSNIFFDFETVTNGPHLIFIGTSTLIAFILSKTKLILSIRKFVTWLSMG
jgi:hypothetical protein